MFLKFRLKSIIMKFMSLNAVKKHKFIKIKFKNFILINFLQKTIIIMHETSKKSEENPNALSEKQSMKKPLTTAKMHDSFIELNAKKLIAKEKTKDGLML